MAPPCCPPGNLATVQSSPLDGEHSKTQRDRVLRQARLHRQRHARAGDQAELVRLREQLALKPQYIVLPVRKDVVTNEIGTQTDADVGCPIGFDLYGCSQADSVGENKATLDVNEMESVYGLLAEGGGESDAASVIQHSWRLFVFSRKLNSELQEFARMAVQNQGANEKTRTLVHAVKTISRRTLLVKICGDKLNACGGVYPEWLMKCAELLVDKAMLRKDAVAAENG